MSKNLYTTLQQLYSFHDQYVKTHKRYPGFAESLKMMEEKGCLSEIEPPMPRLSGDMSVEEFKSAYAHLPIWASRILENHPDDQLVRENMIFPEDRDVFCVQHIHSFGEDQSYLNTFFEMTYIFEGECDFRFENDAIKLKAGDICIVPPYTQHYIEPKENTFAFEAIARESSFSILFGEMLTAQAVLSDFFRNSLMKKEEGNYFIIHADSNDEMLKWYLQEFVRECMENNPYANSCAVSLLKLFLSTAFRKYGKTARIYNYDFNNIRPDADIILQYIQNNYREVSLAQVADYFHYNRTYISRFIHNHFNKSFMGIITDLKISHAKEYLKNSNRKIADIAVLVGYDSADHFSRTFKKQTGVSPAVYRKNNSAGA